MGRNSQGLRDMAECVKGEIEWGKTGTTKMQTRQKGCLRLIRAYVANIHATPPAFFNTDNNTHIYIQNT